MLGTKSATAKLLAFAAVATATATDCKICSRTSSSKLIIYGNILPQELQFWRNVLPEKICPYSIAVLTIPEFNT